MEKGRTSGRRAGGGGADRLDQLEDLDVDVGVLGDLELQSEPAGAVPAVETARHPHRGAEGRLVGATGPGDAQHEAVEPLEPAELRGGDHDSGATAPELDHPSGHRERCDRPRLEGWVVGGPGRRRLGHGPQHRGDLDAGGDRIAELAAPGPGRERARERDHEPGAVAIRAENWRAILDLARETGALPERLADNLEAGLSLVAQLSGSPETLDIPLDFADGHMRLGPIPLGPAPRLVIR
ncbi:MAG: DUF2125 domain-containing protein [Rhodosalinus sp.]